MGFKVVHHQQPELRGLGLLDPQTRNILVGKRPESHDKASLFLSFGSYRRCCDVMSITTNKSIRDSAMALELPPDIKALTGLLMRLAV